MVGYVSTAIQQQLPSFTALDASGLDLTTPTCVDVGALVSGGLFSGGDMLCRMTVAGHWGLDFVAPGAKQRASRTLKSGRPLPCCPLTCMRGYAESLPDGTWQL